MGFFVDPSDKTLLELKAIVLGEALNNGKSLYTQLHTAEAPLAAWFSGWTEWLFGRSVTARHILAFLIIVLQGSYFAVLLINNKAQSENTYLPALLYGVFCLFSFDMLQLSPELMAASILLLALNNLFKEVEFRLQRVDTLLALGFFLGLASLFVSSYIVFLPGTILILALFTRLSLSKVLLLLLGFVLPHALLASVFYFKGNFELLWTNYYSATIWLDENSISVTGLFFLTAIPLLFFLLSLVILNREARLTKYQSQLLQIMLLWFLIATVEIVLAGGLAPHKLITLAPSLAYFISHYILLVRRKWLAETLLWFFVLGIVLVSYLARYSKIKGVDYAGLFYAKTEQTFSNKKIVVFDNQWGYFEQNTLATGFYDWSVSQRYLTETDFFENVVLIDKNFRNDMPDVIVDPHRVMPNIFERIPDLEKKYVRAGNNYILKQ